MRQRRPNQFGGSVVDPLVKGKAFFFLSDESYRRRSGINAIAVLPNPDSNFKDRQGKSEACHQHIVRPTPETRTQTPTAWDHASGMGGKL